MRTAPREPNAGEQLLGCLVVLIVLAVSASFLVGFVWVVVQLIAYGYRVLFSPLL